MPPLLDTEGLVPALKNYLEGVGAKAQINFKVNVRGDIKLSALVAYQLFRILQELTTNMIKYGNVTECNIDINLDKQSLIIIITDDGTSFNFKENLIKPNASGLKNINSRLHAVGGIITQEEDRQKGNCFTITLKNINNA